MPALYTVTGQVQSHRGRGRQLGVPTINITAPATIPDGIYAGFVFWQQQRLEAAIFVGAAITFGETERQVEAYLLTPPAVVDSWGTITLELTHFIRPNMQFANAAELQQQMALDIEEISKCLQESSKL